MLRRLFGFVFAAVALFALPATAETLKIMGAGSLRVALTDLLHRFQVGDDTIAEPEFGASGLMRQKIEAGAPADLFASADMEQARKLRLIIPSAWSFISRAIVYVPSLALASA